MGRRTKLLPAFFIAPLIFALCGVLSLAAGQEASCVRDDFVAVVDTAAASLRALNQANKTKFQDRLRKLKTKNGWSNEEYLKAAEPYVRDPKIAEFDATSAKLLGEIAALGHEGSEASTLDCGVLTQLRARMDVLVNTQKDKWAYMFENIDKSLSQ